MAELSRSVEDTGGGLWTVGYWDAGEWVAEEDYLTREEAEAALLELEATTPAGR